MSSVLADTRSTRSTPTPTATPTTTTPTTTTTTTTTHTLTTATTTTATTRPFLLHPRRPPSRNKILCEFAQNQSLNSYGSWRFTDLATSYKSNHSSPSHSPSRSPISSGSDSERDHHSRDSIGSSGNSNSAAYDYDRDVLRARALRGSSSLGSSWGVSSIGKSFDWTWNASDDTAGASDADTEPTDVDDATVDEAAAGRAQPRKPQPQPQPQPQPSSDGDNRQRQEKQEKQEKEQERVVESPKPLRSFGFHSIGSPLSTGAHTTPNNIIDLTPLTPLNPLTPPRLHFAPNLNNFTALTNLAMTPSSQQPSLLTSPIYTESPPQSPFVSHTVSRAPSSAGSTSSSRFRRRSSQKRFSLVAGRLSYTPDLDAAADANRHLHGAADGENGNDDTTDQRSPRLLRLNSTSSFASLASTVATAPSTPAARPGDFLGERSISEFVIQGDVGRGAYGLVKRGREVMSDGSYGPEVIIKQVIKSRILADCWKKHPTHGTIPIEIYVMLALSSASYVLPERRPWDPRRGIWRAERQERNEREDKERADSGSSSGEFNPPPSASSTTSNSTFTNHTVVPGADDDHDHEEEPVLPDLVTPDEKKPQTLEEKYREYTAMMQPEWEWQEGKIVRGHPNICQLIDFFEDRNYYYLILPSTLPPLDSTTTAAPDAPPAAKDLFDLVEQHPLGLPVHLVRSYLGQIADAMAFLHMRGIVHRDIKDENVVLSANGERCWLIDFGSAGIVRRNGWNSFSGTLDYASPEILRGEFYTGKEQDVWAYGVVAYVLLVGECPFATAADAQAGLAAGSRAWAALEARCGGEDKEGKDGEEEDGGGALCDAAELVRQCLQVDIAARPTAEGILASRFLNGRGGWGKDRAATTTTTAAASAA